MMIYYLLVKIISAVLITHVVKVQGTVTDKEYALMPPLFHLDNFDLCMSLRENALYCSITTQLSPIDPQQPSEVWQIIQKVISNEKNYRHDKLRHGICVPHSCPTLSRNITIYKANHEVLREELSTCYSKKYLHLGLKSTVTDMHCENQEPFYDIDSYDKWVAACLFILFVMILCGSLYEGIARYKANKEYIKATNSAVGRILSCFSIPKNWERLRSISDSRDALALRCLNSVRFYSMVLVILTHTSMIAFAGPVLNPQFLEKIYEDPLNMLLMNGTYVVQTYFMMAGWLLSYNFFLTFEKRKDVKLTHIIVAFVYRYIRLTPCLLVVIAISNSWVYHISRGPIWDKLVGNEYKFCRKNWWTNLLYINNYYDSKHMCIQQTWSLACDTQLFLLALIILTIACKHQKRIKLIFGTSLTIAVLIPGVINYINDYDIVVRQYPEALYEMNLHVPQWHVIYASGYTNAGAYIIGLIVGYIFYMSKYREQKIMSNKLYIALWWIVTWVLPLSMIFIGVPIYKDDYEHSRIIAAIYVSLARNVYVVGVAVGLFGVTQGIGWFLRDVLNWQPLQVFGRLSYSAYLIHVVAIRVRGGLIRTPNYINNYIIFAQMIGDVTVTYIFAVMLCLFVEMPVSALQKLLMPELKQSQIKKNYTDKKAK